ncbi:hypothetical protein J32TS2_31290 [Shouchella clausii]|nr:hypothetical protein J32TS2_31290 [Shouchella clausii]
MIERRPMILVLIGFIGVVLFAVGIFFSSNSVGPIIGITGAFSLSYSAYKLTSGLMKNKT